MGQQHWLTFQGATAPHRFWQGVCILLVLRIAQLPGESQPVIFSVHGAIAKHYKIDPAKLQASHISTIDYVIAATAG
jgi:hypothetical protein